MFLALRLVERMREQNIVTEIMRAFFNRKNDPCKNRICDGRDDQAEKFCGFRPQSLCAGIRDVAHLLRERFYFGFCRGGNVRRVAQRLRDRHHGNAQSQGNIFESDHFISEISSAPLQFPAQRLQK